MTRKEKKKFYGSAAWRHKQPEIMRRDHFECQECRRRLARAKQEGLQLPPRERVIRRAALVHHIIHLEDAPELGLVDDNLEAVCSTCHNRLHGRTVEEFRFKRRKDYVTPERW